MSFNRVAAVFIVALAFSALAAAQWYPTPFGSSRTKLRAYVGATAQQYDTLGNAASQVTVEGLSVWAADSAQTGQTLNLAFVSSVSKREYLRLTMSGWSANAGLEKHWVGPWTFPKDSTILVYYNITGATPATLDTVIVRGTATVRPSR